MDGEKQQNGDKRRVLIVFTPSKDEYLTHFKDDKSKLKAMAMKLGTKIAIAMVMAIALLNASGFF